MSQPMWSQLGSYVRLNMAVIRLSRQLVQYTMRWLPQDPTLYAFLPRLTGHLTRKLAYILGGMIAKLTRYGRDPPYFYRAVMFYYNERIIANFSRRLLTGNPFSPRTKSIPGLSEIQAEALDTLHFLAQKHQVKFEVREGDMRFINNFAFLHGRSAYSDEENSTVTGQPADEEMRSRRHLMRLWLHNPRKAWSLPPALKLIWARTFDDADRLRRWDPSSSLEDNDAVTVKPPQKPIPNPKPKPRPQPPPATAPCD